MADTSDKLEKFKNAVLLKAEKQIKEIEDQINQIKQKEFEKLEKEQLERSNELINKVKSQLYSDFKRKLSVSEANLRKELLKCRKDITDKIFDKVKILLLDFCNTEDYWHFMINKIDKIAKSWKISDFSLYLSRNDFDKKDRILSQINCTVKKDESITIGGFKIKINDSNVVLDETLDSVVESKYSSFNGISGICVI